MEISLVLSSSVLAGLVAGLVALRSGERKIQIENVTQERAKWRSKIRELSLAVHQATTSRNSARLGELVMEFSLLLNPIDGEDKVIPDLIYNLANSQDPSELLLEFRERITLLLKHDWERAKHESFSWFLRNKPKKLNYDDFKKDAEAKPMSNCSQKDS